MGDLTKSFSRHEFACHCGCGGTDVEGELVEHLQELRDLIGQPVIVVSGFRCQAHNTAVGGATRSQHLLGRAADVRVRAMSPIEIKRLAETIDAFRDGGIGLYSAFVHLDVRPNGPARWQGATHVA
jgi:zinc D-Ala-D-Ala carboxypeptidase